jgi:hypothetical protein
MIDVFFNFNTGYHERGLLVMDRKKIVKNYIRTWMAFDILSAIPYEWIFNYYHTQL